MKLTTTVLGLGAVIAAAPLAAQMPSRTGQDERPTQAVTPAPAPVSHGGIITHQPKLSNGAGKAIIELQEAVNKNDTASIPAKLAAAQAVAKTPDDKYAIGIMQLKAANAAKDQAGLAAGLEVMLASGSVQPNEQLGLYTALASTYTNLKQSERATAAYKKVVELDPNNVDAVAGLAEAQVAAGQAAAAVALFQQGIKLQSASGKAPEAWYKRAVSVAYGAKLPVTGQLAREWVAAYPNAGSWRDAIAIYRNLNQQDVEGTLDLLRLMRAAGALSASADYNLFAAAASDQGNFLEAQKVLDAGIAAKHVDPASPVFRDLVAGLKAKQKPTAADLAVAAKTAANTKALIRIGDSYAALGDHAKAAEVFRTALTKPDVDAPVANLHLGMALAQSGDKAGATAALNAVTGPRSEIAKYWLLYLQSHA